MAEQDIPFLDGSIAQLPSDLRQDLALRLSGELFAFSKFVMGFSDMTSRAHGPMCVFLDRNEAQVKAVGMPRATFKTSIGTEARTLQRVIKNRNRTQAIVNEKMDNAARFVGVIKQTAESNKIFRALYSDIIPKNFRATTWNDSELLFNRDVVKPEPTVTALGILSAWTSQHYDDITYDDIISEDAAKSEKVMADTTDRALKFRSLFVDPYDSTLTVMFTRWGFADSYHHLFRALGSKMAKLIRGAVEDDGPIFPERLGLDILAQIRQEIGEYSFSCLYMNNPRNAEIQDFNVSDLRFWKWSSDEREIILLDAEGREFRRYPVQGLDITATVDLAAAEKITSDRNAITVTGISANGEAIVLESWAKRCTPIELLEQLTYLHRRWSPRVWGIEDVAYQKAFKYFLRDYAEKEGLYFNIRPIKAIKAKNTRIRGLQPLAATHRLYLSAEQHLLRNELADFPLGEHDDALDSLSMQLQLWENQLSPKSIKRQLEVEQEILRDIRLSQLTLDGGSPTDAFLEEDDYQPAYYVSYDLGI